MQDFHLHSNQQRLTAQSRFPTESDPEDLAHISPYLTEHINRFGEYSTHELGIQPEAYDPKLDVDFTPLREQDLTAAGLGQAA
ncbi:hypothetical protein [Streptomyces sp. NPDC057580]|uniref:hypothetical protein n=1 Tax=Streptomyces sp. NPDC057580 TaxID=3346173 RepID=UPI0036CE7022